MKYLISILLFAAIFTCVRPLDTHAQMTTQYGAAPHHRYGTVALIDRNEDVWTKHIGICGKITDEKGVTIENATLTIINGSHFFDAVMMEDGTFYTDSLMPGDYDIAINANDVVYKSKISLKQADNGQHGYNFQITKNGIRLTVSDVNPFGEKTLKRIKKEPAKIIY